MQQYPQSPDVTGQPPVYHQDPNAQYQQQQQPMYAQHTGSPQPQHPQGAYIQPDHAVQQPGMPPQQQTGTVYQNATPIANLGRGPAPADCPACGQRAMTNVAFETGNTTHLWGIVCCCFACLGCIPYVMNSLKDVQHKCGRCGVLLATWHRSGTTEVHIHS
jgi:lipopolysaccharide-induced tumor necrosis factor-alpha factor